MFAADNDDVVPIDEQELNEKLYHHMVREREQEQRWEQERRWAKPRCDHGRTETRFR